MDTDTMMLGVLYGVESNLERENAGILYGVQSNLQRENDTKDRQVTTTDNTNRHVHHE